MPSENLPTPYYQQDTPTYCGAACARMVLESIGAGVLDQDDLYDDNHSHSKIEPGIWASGPDGLRWTMNHYRPAGPGKHFVLFARASEQSISRKIVWTIHQYQVAPIALVNGKQHWLVVRGFTASAAPSRSGDQSYDITAFDVNDPFSGFAPEHISYLTWQDTYMTGVDDGYWSGKYLAVCDPEPPPDGADAGRTPGFPPPRRAGNLLVAAEEAATLARDGLRAYRLLERAAYRWALERASFGSPVLVQRLDRNDMFQYIVPAESRERASIPLAVIIDARTGEYRQSIAVDREEVSVFTPMSRAEAARVVIGNSWELPDQRGRLLVRPEAVCHHPTMVWQPCRESLSPYRPFHMFTVGARHVYVRTDGAVFTELHDQDRGI